MTFEGMRAGGGGVEIEKGGFLRNSPLGSKKFPNVPWDLVVYK